MLHYASIISTDPYFSFRCLKSLSKIINDKMFMYKHHIAELCRGGFVQYHDFVGGGGDKFLSL